MSSKKKRQPTPTSTFVSSSDRDDGEDVFLVGVGTPDQQHTHHQVISSAAQPADVLTHTFPPRLEEQQHDSLPGSNSVQQQHQSIHINEKILRNSSNCRTGRTSSLTKDGSRISAISHGPLIPHRNSLRKINLASYEKLSSRAADQISKEPQHKPPKALYSIELPLDLVKGLGQEKRLNGQSSLIFTKSQLDTMQRLFLVLDTENKGFVTFQQVEEFVHVRCPVVRRRDYALMIQTQHLEKNSVEPPVGTLLESWCAITHSGLSREEISLLGAPETSNAEYAYSVSQMTALGLEGWMILLRFISFCQYHEAKQLFSAKRLGSNMVVVDVPRDPAVIPLTMEFLLLFEHKFDYRKVLNGEKKPKSGEHGKVKTQSESSGPPQYCPPMPELDLNHSGIAAQEDPNLLAAVGTVRLPAPRVNIDAMGSYSDAAWKAGKVDLNLTLTSTNIMRNRLGVGAALMSTSIECTTSSTTVRRSLEDLQWLNDTFLVHKKLGGTLCGRILPPFLPDDSNSLAVDIYPTDMTSTSSVFSYVRSVGKTVLGTIQKNTGLSSFGSSGTSSRKNSDSFGSMTQECRLKRLNRCTNYLLEHSGLQSSFPLNSFLKASKTGLEATKRIVDESKSNAAISVRNRESGVTSSPAGAEKGGSNTSDHNSQENPSEASSYVSLNWIRHAAQAAVTLKVHGILNATGMSTYSAKLQHASLPDFDYHQSYRGTSQNIHPTHLKANPTNPQAHSKGFDGNAAEIQSGFESKVTSVECGLDDEYDLLPAPNQVRGSFYEESDFAEIPDQLSNDLGSENDPKSVDNTINKLRCVIASVDEHLSRCAAFHDKISEAARARINLHFNIIRAFDSNSFDEDAYNAVDVAMDEQSFLRGITEMERSHEIMILADSGFHEELSWQKDLSSSAVLAANDVRAAARAARRAAGAKKAAEAAASRAKTALKKQIESISAANSPSDLEPFEIRYENTRNHAMHAAIVAHETTTVKRKAAMALASDVRQWSDHRRREMFKACLLFAQLHREASHDARRAWTVLKQAVTGPQESSEPMGKSKVSQVEKTKFSVSQEFSHDSFAEMKLNDSELHLMDGFYDAPRTINMQSSATYLSTVAETDVSHSRVDVSLNEEQLRAPIETSLIYEESHHHDSYHYRKSKKNPDDESCEDLVGLGLPYSLGLEYRDLVPAGSHTGGILDEAFRAMETPFAVDEDAPPPDFPPSYSDVFPSSASSESVNNRIQEATQDTFDVVEPISEVGPEEDSCQHDAEVAMESEIDRNSLDCSSSKMNITTSKSVTNTSSGGINLSGSETDASLSEKAGESNDAMTASMQSLVDGLMAWGSRYDPTDDIPIPSGLVASILEEPESDHLLERAHMHET